MVGVMRHGIMAALVAVAALFSLNAASASDTPSVGPDSNLPVPRFVSLKTEGANGRRGPGLEHQVDWVYERVGLPLQVTGESGPWRRVVDPDGDQVWIHAGQRTSKRRWPCGETRAKARRSWPIWRPVLSSALPAVMANGGA
jgi:SH3-like domain-containing protein